MKLTFQVLEGGFVEKGYKYVLRATPDQNGTNGYNQGNIVVFSDTLIPSFSSNAKVTIDIPMVADAS